MLPLLQPLPLVRRPAPFSHPDWLFEIKYDGFRALAYCDPSGIRLISRNGNRFASFTDLCAGMEFSLGARHAVLDGEIVCLDENGCSQFNQLLFRRGTARFCAFDLLHLNGKGLRNAPLIEPKRTLRKIVPRSAVSLLYVDHVDAEGERLFHAACERDLTGVSKHGGIVSFLANQPVNAPHRGVTNQRSEVLTLILEEPTDERDQHFTWFTTRSGVSGSIPSGAQPFGSMKKNGKER